MTHTKIALLALTVFGAFACGESRSLVGKNNSDGAAGSGGNLAGSGGGSGTVGSGGAASSGGAHASGGTTSTGGALGSGGTTGSGVGGSIALGGAAAGASGGGTSGSGGVGSGGASGTGGVRDAAASDGPFQCEYGGKLYNVDETRGLSDCNYCVCSASYRGWACTGMICSTGGASGTGGAGGGGGGSDAGSDAYCPVFGANCIYGYVTDSHGCRICAPSPSDAGSDGGKPDVLVSPDAQALAQLCSSTAGQIKSQSCCSSAGDFPDLCSVGACGCAPGSSHAIAICECPSGTCFSPTSGCASSSGLDGCRADPGLDTSYCGVTNPPHYYGCVGTVLPDPCVQVSFGDMTNGFCCP